MHNNCKLDIRCKVGKLGGELCWRCVSCDWLIGGCLMSALVEHWNWTPICILFWVNELILKRLVKKIQSQKVKTMWYVYFCPLLSVNVCFILHLLLLQQNNNNPLPQGQPESSGDSSSWSWLLAWAPCCSRKEAFSKRPSSTARKRGVWPRGVRQSTESGPEAGQQDTEREATAGLCGGRAEDANLWAWAPGRLGLSEWLRRVEESNLCCPAVRTCPCGGWTDPSGASHCLGRSHEVKWIGHVTLK